MVMIPQRRRFLIVRIRVDPILEIGTFRTIVLSEPLLRQAITSGGAVTAVKMSDGRHIAVLKRFLVGRGKVQRSVHGQKMAFERKLVLPVQFDFGAGMGDDGRARICWRVAGLAIAPDGRQQRIPIRVDKPKPLLGLTYLKDVRPGPARIDPFRQRKLVDKAGLSGWVEKLNVLRFDGTEQPLRLPRLVELRGPPGREVEQVGRRKARATVLDGPHCPQTSRFHCPKTSPFQCLSDEVGPEAAEILA